MLGGKNLGGKAWGRRRGGMGIRHVVHSSTVRQIPRVIRVTYKVGGVQSELLLTKTIAPGVDLFNRYYIDDGTGDAGLLQATSDTIYHLTISPAPLQNDWEAPRFIETETTDTVSTLSDWWLEPWALTPPDAPVDVELVNVEVVEWLPVETF